MDPDPSFIFPPNTPEYIKIINGNDSTLIVSCEPTFQATQYIAYVSLDGVTFTDTVISVTNNIAVTNLTENTVYYFKVRAANDSGASAITQYLYGGIPSSSPHEVLVIDGVTVSDRVVLRPLGLIFRRCKRTSSCGGRRMS